MNLADRIMGVESGGNPNAQNPRSSAGGAGQFIDATWLDMLRRHRPDIQGSLPELLAMKRDLNLSREMTDAYARDNAAILAQAGHDATPGNTYLAHFAGPQGAASVLSADPAAPVSSILTPGAVRANPFLQNMTAGDLRAWADRKMGGQPATTPKPPQQLAAMLDLPQQPEQPQSQPAPQAPPRAAMSVAPIPESPAPRIGGLIEDDPPRIDLRKLQQAFKAPQSRGFFFGRS